MEDIKLERPFAIVIEPSLHPGEEDHWYAKIIGHQMDHITYYKDPLGALLMAYDILCLLTGKCSKLDEVDSLAHETHTFEVETTFDDGQPAVGCSKCSTKEAK